MTRVIIVWQYQYWLTVIGYHYIFVCGLIALYVCGTFGGNLSCSLADFVSITNRSQHEYPFSMHKYLLELMHLSVSFVHCARVCVFVCACVYVCLHAK